MNLFGKAKTKSKANTDTSASIAKLRETLESLDKREGYIQKKIKDQLLVAKAKSKAKDKKGAMFALKRKKMFEGEVNKLNGARMTLESQIMALEGANTNALTFNAMRTGAQAMKDARGNLDADDEDDVMDDIKEEMDTADQIGEAIARPAGDLFDDDELMEELNMLEGAELEEKLLEPPAIPTARPASPEAATVSETKVPDLPSVPTATPSMLVEPVSAEEHEEERALRELEASMAT